MDRIFIGKKIKIKREKINNSQEGLASSLNMSVKTIQRMEKGENNVSEELFLKTLNFLSIEYCANNSIVIPEVSSISSFIKNVSDYSFSVIDRDSLSIKELNIVLKLAYQLENLRNISFSKQIENEISLFNLFEELNQNNIKIYSSIKKDAEIMKSTIDGYQIWLEEHNPIHQIYIYKKTHQKVNIMRDGKTYIVINDENYKNLKYQRKAMKLENSIEKYQFLFTEKEREEYQNIINNLNNSV